MHPQAQLAAEASEAAAAQDAFWPMHDLLLAHQDKLTGPDLLRYARRLGLDERALPGRPDAARARRPGRPGRGERRHQRGVRHTDVLRQRPALHGPVQRRGLAEAVRAARTRAELGARTQDQADVRVRTRPRRGFL